MTFSFLSRRICSLEQQAELCRRITVGAIARDQIKPDDMVYAMRAARMARRLEHLSYRPVAYGGAK